MKLYLHLYFNRTMSFVLTVFIILMIGYIDVLTGTEMAFSFFYLLPIILLAINSNVNLIDIITCSVVAASSWSYSEYAHISLSNTFFPIWNSTVRLLIFVIIGTLIYRLKEKENRIQSTNQKLKKLNLEKNKFIGIAAHDLANPIGAINSFADLLIDNCAQNNLAEVSEGLEIIKTLSANTMAVLKNLLNVAVIESGKIDLKMHQEDYINFIRNQITYNQIVAKNKCIKIELKTNLQFIPLHFDTHYLSEVISNLLSNAIKYSYPESTIIVQVSQEDNSIITKIIDNGKGIPEKEQQNLFYYFEKSSTQPTAGESSTGLGLAIAKQIVNLHQGTIGLKSKINEGTTFYFSLPMKK
ncbi:sensor histidine kinase [Flavobacterium sp. 7A]|uniref:sensor histidine kinase n=1 Tax=Flavobacterium sp. 7A TaxID=2940571 RepID=UPI0022272E88|nr:HAMP domain-containing sensor histidine kinase [Flavobacterium sp. 7A]MCW2118433.1 signal transduction histidine kinase [Flavobacterium sp. 7A]